MIGSTHVSRLSPWCFLVALAACGESVPGGDSPGAGMAGASAQGGSGAVSGGAPMLAGGAGASGGAAAGGRAPAGGRGAAAGVAGVVAGSGAGSGRDGASGRVGQSGGGIGGSGGMSTLAGRGGLPAGGATQGGAGQGGVAHAGRAQGGFSGDGAGGAGGSGRCTVADPPQTYNPTAAAYTATIVDFSRYGGDGTWTNADATGISGTTTFYHDEGGSNLVLTVVNDMLHVTGTVPAALKHAGWIFAFDSCVAGGDSNFGVALSLDGNWTGLRLTLALQTNADYPIDVNRGKGTCAFISCETRKPECAFPYAPIQPVNTTYWYHQWSEFTYGAPESSVSATSPLWGLKFDVECYQDIADCPVDLTIGMLRFFSV